MAERERWLAAVQARLERVTAQDLSPVLEEMAHTEARELARTLTDDDPGSLPAMYYLGWLHWYRVLALPEGHGRQDLEIAVTMFTSCFINGIDGLPGSLMPLLADGAVPAATELLQRTQRSHDLELLTAAIDLWQRILTATSADDSERAGRLSNLGAALLNRLERTGAADDLDAAITYLRKAVQATPADHPDRAAILSNLGNALQARFANTGVVGDLDEAIEAGRHAVRAAPSGYPGRPAILSNLGNGLQTRFARTGAVGDLDEAVTYLRDAVRTAPSDHPGRALYQSNLGKALRVRFGRTGAVADLDAAVEAAQQAVQATPADHPERGPHLSNLGKALQARFGRTGAAADLDTAITCLRQAVPAIPADHSDHAGVLLNLGTMLRVRFGRTGAVGDLDEAITYLQQAVETIAADHPGRALSLSNLGVALQARFGHAGAAGDLNAAIAYLRQAVHATPADHPERAPHLSNLAIALQARFGHAGAAADLEAAIEAAQQAVQATPADHPERALYLSVLGNALRIRFGRTGAAADLNAAITYLREAVQVTPADHPDRAPYLSNLGIALQVRSSRTWAAGDLDEAITCLQLAVQAIPADHHDRALYLSNLGNALRVRFVEAGAVGDLDAAIPYLREAVEVMPADRPERAGHLSNLGIALRFRFRRTGAAADLDAAIEAGQQAMRATPAGHPERAEMLSNLGDALRDRFERTGAAADKNAAFERYTEAANVDLAAASARIDAGRRAALLVAETDPGRAADLLEAAVALLPEVAPRSLERGDQQFAISRFAGLAADAASLALSDPAVPEPQRPAQALRLLEAARGLLLSQALSTRGDLSELHAHHPELAVRFTELRDRLDQPSPVAATELADLPGTTSADSLQRTIRNRRQANAEFTQLLAQIRSLERFETFALPPSAEQLEAQAQQGPVVVFNVSRHRSDAILLTTSGITSQPLPGLDQATVIEQVTTFSQALHMIATAESPLDRANAQRTILQVLAWLWDNATGPILHALGYQGPHAHGEPWPRLWWVPGGLLSLLPIHASGHHTNPPDPGHRTVMDRVISSYTPTVGTLAHSRAAHTATDSAAIRSLIVAMPTTPGLPDEGRLRYVPAEAAMLQGRLPHPIVLTEPAGDKTAVGQLPTKAAVVGHLPACAIAHFACHGYTDPADPSQSRLLLHDHRRDPLTVAALAPLALDHAELAYLSACGTARVTDTRLLDEAIHLASAFQLAGFPRVIGTLWEIDDAIAVEIADAFYTALTDPAGALDPALAAHALHQAIRTLRDRQPITPYLWASHIHAGV